MIDHHTQRCSGQLVPGLRSAVVTVMVVLSAIASLSCSSDDSADAVPVDHQPVSTEIRITPADDLQRMVDSAAEAGAATVILASGTYRPKQPGQALLVMTRRHDGLTLRADVPGSVVLTAANEALTEPAASGFPAVVNHVLLTGPGVSSKTVFEGLTFTGANGYVSETPEALLNTYPEFQTDLPTGMFFQLDGGGLKVFGDSSPRFINCRFVGNRTRLCGGGVSIEQSFRSEEPVRFTGCVFRDNHCPATGAGVDVLAGGLAEFENCLFVGNIGNTGMAMIAQTIGLSYNAEHGCGALTVFPQSRVRVRNCTFTGNWNGVDDHGSGSRYENSIFWMNDAWDESRPGGPYELDVVAPANVAGCLVNGNIPDLRNSISAEHNHLEAPAPEFNEFFEPRHPAYQQAGYRRSISRSRDHTDYDAGHGSDHRPEDRSHEQE